jgi:hypothetical protein
MSPCRTPPKNTSAPFLSQALLPAKKQAMLPKSGSMHLESDAMHLFEIELGI